MSRISKREPRDPIRRLEATLRSPEFRYVSKTYCEKLGLPPNSVDWPDARGWEKARLHDKGAWGEKGRAVERICGWLDIGYDAIPILAQHIFLNSSLPTKEFASRFADLLQKTTLQHLANIGRFEPPGSIGAVHGQRAEKVLERPLMRRQDLPLLLLIEGTPDASWAGRAANWNQSFPRRPVSSAETLARYYRGARQREAQRLSYPTQR